MKKQVPSQYKVLTIAGSDSGGGAGIQADIKTITALGGYATTVITALTAQNTLGVQSIFEIPASFVGQQIDAIVTDIGTDAVKTGMLLNKGIVDVVSLKIKEHNINMLDVMFFDFQTNYIHNALVQQHPCLNGIRTNVSHYGIYLLTHKGCWYFENGLYTEGILGC